MTGLPLRDALAPIAARMVKIVREHEILRVAANIPGKDPPKLAESARRETLAWVQRRTGGRLPENAWEFQSFECLSGGRNSVGDRIENGDLDIWAVRADDPDKTVPGRVWTTEVVVGLGRDGPPLFSARLLVSTPESDLDIEPHTPGFVQQIAKKCGLWRGPYELSASPQLINSAEEVENLIDILIDPNRQLPAFVLTVPENAIDPARPLLDATALAKATLGIAHVIVLSAALTWALTNRFGKQRSVFGGGVRSYLPGFTEDADPYDHRLIIADRISTADGAAQCMRWLRSLAASESIRRTRLGNDVVAFAAIRGASLQLKQERLEREGASESERLAAALARIEALESQVGDEKASLEYFSTEHQRAGLRAERAEAQSRAAAFRIQQLIGQLAAKGEIADAAIELPAGWGEFANWCEMNLVGRVELSAAARNGVKSPKFEDVGLAARCLLWLANSGRDRRIHGRGGSLSDEPVEQGVRNSHCGNDQFDFDWQGRRYTADWHIKNGGNTRDPRRCLRIYYCWDADTQQIIVAEMPAHRRTGAS